MSRILNLQRMEAANTLPAADDALADSTCSFVECDDCSTYSNTNCSPKTEMFIVG